MSSVEVGQSPQEVGNKLWYPALAGGAAAAAAVGIYLQARSERLEASILPYAEDVANVMEGTRYAVVGGLPIDAFNHADTVIDPEQRTIRVSAEFATPGNTPLFRENHSIRDFDIFIMGKTPDRFENVPKENRDELQASLKTEAAVRSGQLGIKQIPVMSVFAFDTDTSLVNTATFLEADSSVTLQHADAIKTLPDSALETWDLMLPNGRVVKILNPWEQYWRSRVRFLSGQKTKDDEKLGKMLAKLRSTPGLAEMEDSELCQAYGEYEQVMRWGCSRNALNEAFADDRRDWSQVSQIAKLAVTKQVMRTGQQSKTVTRIVQTLPVVFDLFSGTK